MSAECILRSGHMSRRGEHLTNVVDEVGQRNTGIMSETLFYETIGDANNKTIINTMSFYKLRNSPKKMGPTSNITFPTKIFLKSLHNR